MLSCTTEQEKIEAARQLLFKRPEVYFTIAMKVLPRDINITKTDIKENRFVMLLADVRKQLNV